MGHVLQVAVQSGSVLAEEWIVQDMNRLLRGWAGYFK
jgi:hypothetical protein